MTSYTQIPSLILSLKQQIDGLKHHFPHHAEVGGVLLTGSCSRGDATYRSDIDLLVILKEGSLNYGRVKKIRDDVESAFQAKGKSDLLHSPLPVEMTIVKDSVFSTQENKTYCSAGYRALGRFPLEA